MIDPRTFKFSLFLINICLKFMGYGDILTTWNKPDDPNEIVRHSILLLCLGLSMFVGMRKHNEV